jgi:hypothetical protein
MLDYAHPFHVENPRFLGEHTRLSGPKDSFPVQRLRGKVGATHTLKAFHRFMIAAFVVIIEKKADKRCYKCFTIVVTKIADTIMREDLSDETFGGFSCRLYPNTPHHS